MVEFKHLFTLLADEQRYYQQLTLFLDTHAQSSLLSLSAYASAAPPPIARAIIAVAGCLASADDGLRRYAASIEEWIAELRTLNDLEDEEMSNTPNGAERHSGRTPRPLRRVTKSTMARASKQSMPTGSREDLTQQEEFQSAVEAAYEQDRLDALRLEAVKRGLGARCVAMVECGQNWLEVGQAALRVLETVSKARKDRHHWAQAQSSRNHDPTVPGPERSPRRPSPRPSPRRSPASQDLPTWPDNRPHSIIVSSVSSLSLSTLSTPPLSPLLNQPTTLPRTYESQPVAGPSSLKLPLPVPFSSNSDGTSSRVTLPESSPRRSPSEPPSEPQPPSRFASNRRLLQPDGDSSRVTLPDSSTRGSPKLPPSDSQPPTRSASSRRLLQPPPELEGLLAPIDIPGYFSDDESAISVSDGNAPAASGLQQPADGGASSTSQSALSGRSGGVRSLLRGLKGVFKRHEHGCKCEDCVQQGPVDGTGGGGDSGTRVRRDPRDEGRRHALFVDDYIAALEAGQIGNRGVFKGAPETAPRGMQSSSSQVEVGSSSALSSRQQHRRAVSHSQPSRPSPASSPSVASGPVIIRTPADAYNGEARGDGKAPRHVRFSESHAGKQTGASTPF
ncbi:hypothetical protein FA95DRAFT_1563707 [Auriscalpium vulgare]|uniref:Uncharacterized protein n=1 Tax=Auriscalpium vulgare TaxID=40419 RepID=A0ACB8RGL6_9AGAM|nr:hypothetical protein FA95DRAFT_1563707 [Auriscalpium vulgare]